MRNLVSLVAGAALAACASSTPISQTPRAAPNTGSVPTGVLPLGDYRSADAAAVARAFSTTISGRYGRNLTLAQAVADLSRNRFGCTAPPASGPGDPPDRLCQRVVREGACAHSWRVMLYSDRAGGAVDRTRGLYDRACGGGTGLLGGR